VGWKRARKICEKHWRRSENNCWRRDGTSAVTVVASPSISLASSHRAPNRWWRTPRPRSPPSELPWRSARPLLSRRRQSARALLGRKRRCTEFSAPAHQLQPNIRIWIGSPVVPVAPDRLAVGRLAGPEWSSAGAALSRWPVVIAGASPGYSWLERTSTATLRQRMLQLPT
jgi:hypothetical protein